MKNLLFMMVVVMGLQTSILGYCRGGGCPEGCSSCGSANPESDWDDCQADIDACGGPKSGYAPADMDADGINDFCMYVGQAQ